MHRNRATASQGLVIVFEGADGVGKTTQVRRLVARLSAAGIAHEHLREPGGTSIGEAVRQLLLEPIHTIAPAAEALLFMVSRAQLITDRIRPALDEGKVVVLDRFFLSTYAYQIAGRGLDAALVQSANQLAVQGLVPDVTLLLDLPTPDGFARADSRGARDRMEQAGDDFHARVAHAFAEYGTEAWQRAHPECGPVARIDARGDETVVEARIADALYAAYPKVFAPLMAGSPSGFPSGSAA